MESTAPHRRPQQPLLVTTVPTSLLTDARLSGAARGIAAEAMARAGRLNVAEVAARDGESVDVVLDAVAVLLEHGYAVLTGETLELTPAYGWAAA